MKSVLYCGCTVNAYTPCSPPRLSLSLFPPEDPAVSLVLSLSLSLPRPLSLSPSLPLAPWPWPVVSSSLFARYLARWAPAQPMKARGGELLRRSYGMAGIAGGWGPLPPQRSYCFNHPTASQPPPWYRSTSLLLLFSWCRGTVLRILMDRLRNCWRN